MSLSVAGVWAVGVWDQTVWADGVWSEGAAVIGVPTEAGREGGTYAGYQKGKRRKQRIMDDDAEFILMAQDAIREILKHIH